MEFFLGVSSYISLRDHDRLWVGMHDPNNTNDGFFSSFLSSFPSFLFLTLWSQVAQALQVQFQGRSWRFQVFSIPFLSSPSPNSLFSVVQPEDAEEGSLHEQIVRWFLDSPAPEAHYSVHRVCHLGRVLFKKKIGQWYEPTITCLVFQVLPSFLFFSFLFFSFLFFSFLFFSFLFFSFLFFSFLFFSVFFFLLPLFLSFFSLKFF